MESAAARHLLSVTLPRFSFEAQVHEGGNRPAMLSCISRDAANPLKQYHPSHKTHLGEIHGTGE